MGNLETFINKNRNAFDSEEPSVGHLERFLQQLEAQPSGMAPVRKKRLFFKMAAAILVLLTLGAIGYEFSSHEPGRQLLFSMTQQELPTEISDALQYYDQETATRLATLHSLTQSNHQAKMVSQGILNEIASLDASSTELKEQWFLEPGNDRIEAALIRNQQMKQDILNELIRQISGKINR
jgi:hypothetical protein